MLGEKKLAITQSFIIFITLSVLVLSPVQIASKQLALIEEKTVISAGCMEVTSNDILAIASLAAGSVAMGTLFTYIILPQTEKLRGKR